jgi:penicillin-binding protein 1A
MQPISGDTAARNQAGAEKAVGPIAPTTQIAKNGTAAATRELARALTSDLTAMLLGLRQRAMPFLSGAPLRRQFERDQCDRGSQVAESQTSRMHTSFVRASTIVLRRFATGFSVLAILALFAVSGFLFWAVHDLSPDRPANEANKPGLLLEAVDGEQLGRIGTLKVADVRREDVAEHLIRALISIEDRRFYDHYGFDPVGIARAARRNAAAGDIVEGGSTITQQLVRMRSLEKDRTFTRKVREALTAIWLERHLSKDEILTEYLNNVYMGAGARGMPAAARLFFGKTVSELTLSEAAMLAGVIKAPSQLNPLHDLKAAQHRAAVVLDAMVANGALEEQAAATAKKESATTNRPPELRQASSWFADWAAQEAAQLTGSFTSMRVRTTLDPRLQRLAERVINDALASQKSRARVSQAALVALRPDGAVLAMVGGRDYGRSQFNRAVEANRHPGSAFKLFVYLAALRKGYSPQDLIDGGPVEIKGWRPENFGGARYGRVTLADAFARSINTAAVRLAMDVGLKDVVSAARDLGIDARLSAVPSLALGAAEVSLLDLTGAYASVRAGRKLQPWSVAAFGPENQSTLRSMGPPIVDSAQTLGPAQQPMIELLRHVVERGTGRAASLDGFAAGKTGTSQNHRDAWFIGFNESLVVGVWVGNDDGSPMERIVGGALPASIWKSFMTEATPLVSRDTPRIADFRSSGMEAYAHATSSDFAARTSAASEGQGGRCDYRACASAYRSFRPSDCTYQSYSGGRRICEMRPRMAEDSEPTHTGAIREQGRGGPAASAAEGGRRAAFDTGARDSQGTSEASALPEDARREDGPQRDLRTASPAQAQCNVQTCARKYRSFDPSDCTYQPYDRRQRQVCEIDAQPAQTPGQRSTSANDRGDQSSERAPERTEGQAQIYPWRRLEFPDPVPQRPRREQSRGFFRLF